MKSLYSLTSLDIILCHIEQERYSQSGWHFLKEKQIKNPSNNCGWKDSPLGMVTLMRFYTSASLSLQFSTEISVEIWDNTYRSPFVLCSSLWTNRSVCISAARPNRHCPVWASVQSVSAFRTASVFRICAT